MMTGSKQYGNDFCVSVAMLRARWIGGFEAEEEKYLSWNRDDLNELQLWKQRGFVCTPALIVA
jgi:hypothetical protein